MSYVRLRLGAAGGGRAIVNASGRMPRSTCVHVTGAATGNPSRARGEYAPIPSPEEAAAYPYTPAERELMRRNRARLFVGAPATVKEALSSLAEATQADELMITSAIHDHEARKTSYRLLAEAFGVRAPTAA